jgi:chromosomal replication initiator protein
MITIAEIQQHVADAMGISIIDMHVKDRHLRVARPRQVAMYFSRELTGHSYPEIGRRFGNRDHTTILAGVAKVKWLMKQWPDFAAQVESIREGLGQ